VSIPRYAARVDATQAEIVEAIRKAGWNVVQLKHPVDLLCDKNGVIKLLECKTPKGKRSPKLKLRKDQQAQAEFCRRTMTPYVTTAEEALRALGEI
jgi:Holliday junction resolvase